MVSGDDARLGSAGAELGLELLGVPGAGPLVGVVGDLVAREHARRRSVALRTAEQLSGLTREQLGDVLRTSPGMVNATVAFLYAVGEAGDDDVLVMIGAAMARALRGASEERRDPLTEERLVLRALRGLTSEHVRLMIAMRGYIRTNPDIPISIDQLREQNLVPERLLLSLLTYL
jgi:hypothetical protein